MKIKKKGRRIIFITDVVEGDLFEWNNDIYIKTDTTERHNYICVSLTNGKIISLPPTITDVHEVFATLEIE